MIIDNILKSIEEEEKSRKRTSPIRASASGYCARKIGYQLWEYPAEDLPARAIMTFRLGDTIETEVKALIAKYLPTDHVIEYPQEPCSMVIAGREIQGHVDGVIKSPVSAILEVKSISDAGFKMVERLGVSDDYKCQASFYQKAMGIPRTVFIFYNKNNSAMQQITYEYEESLWKTIEARWQRVIESTKDSLPPREYGPNEKGKLPFQCSYCGWCKTCWVDQELKFSKTGKPEIYVTI